MSDFITQDLIINKLTKEQFKAIVPSETELYLVEEPEINDYAKDIEVVHLDGSETITGVKTFTKNINANSNINLSDTSAIKFYDKLLKVENGKLVFNTEQLALVKDIPLTKSDINTINSTLQQLSESITDIKTDYMTADTVNYLINSLSEQIAEQLNKSQKRIYRLDSFGSTFNLSEHENYYLSNCSGLIEFQLPYSSQLDEDININDLEPSASFYQKLVQISTENTIEVNPGTRAIMGNCEYEMDATSGTFTLQPGSYNFLYERRPGSHQWTMGITTIKFIDEPLDPIPESPNEDETILPIDPPKNIQV